MGFLATLGNAVLDTAVGRSALSQAALREVRREHDSWAREATLGERYFSVAPTTNLSDGGRPSHCSFVFTKRTRDGQLLTDGKTPSWALWQECGPFTPVAQWVHAAERQRLAELDEKLNAGLQDKFARMALDRFTADRIAADVARRYPASAQLAAAA